MVGNKNWFFQKPASRAFGHYLSAVSVDGEHDEDKGRCHIGCCHLWLLQGVTSCLMWGGTGHVICSWGNACVRWAGGKMVIYERTVLCRVLPEQFGKKPPLTSLTSTRDQIASMMSSSSLPSSSPFPSVLSSNRGISKSMRHFMRHFMRYSTILCATQPFGQEVNFILVFHII